jgi:hypothetical protein
MAELATQGFGRWTKRHFQLFIKGLVEHGKDNFAGIAEMIGDRTEEEVKEYSEVFWKRYKELPGVFCVRLLRVQEAMLTLRGLQTGRSTSSVLKLVKSSELAEKPRWTFLRQKWTVSITPCRGCRSRTGKTRGSNTARRRTGSCS